MCEKLNFSHRGEQVGTLEVKSPNILNGYWTDRNNKVIKKATLGEIVRFHIETQGICDNEIVNIIIYDDDGVFNIDDEIEKKNIIIKDNKGYADISLSDSWISYIKDDCGDEIELYCECKYKNTTKELPDDSDNYLLVFEKGEIVTVLIELPHSAETDKLNAKGLGGHTGIIIGDDFYDFGPQPGQPFNSDGRPWWDKFHTDLKKRDILKILNNDYPVNRTDDMNRQNYNIVGKVYLINICIKKSEFVKLKKWWVNRYANLGTYSVIPFIGEQCTTTVRISLEESTSIFSFFTISSTTQTPEGLMELLTSKAKHTAGKNTNETVSITRTFAELKIK